MESHRCQTMDNINGVDLVGRRHVLATNLTHTHTRAHKQVTQSRRQGADAFSVRHSYFSQQAFNNQKQNSDHIIQVDINMKLIRNPVTRP